MRSSHESSSLPSDSKGLAYKHKDKSKAPSPTFVCKFSMKGERLVMSLDEFCNAIGVANTGSWAETG